MFPFTKPLGPNFSHLYLAAYVYVYTSLEPVLETLEKLDPRNKPNIAIADSQKTSPAPQGHVQKEAHRKGTWSEVANEEAEDFSK